MMKIQKLFAIFFAAAWPVTLTAATSFTAGLDPDQVTPPFGVEGDPAASSSFSGIATLVLENGGSLDPVLNYSLVLPGMDLNGSLTPGELSDDVTAIHIHFGAPGANGPHALNIYGLSGGSLREDDADFMMNPLTGTITGAWDNSDQLFTGPGGTKLPFDSVGLDAALADLQAGNLYFQVHTLNFSSGEIRGQILPVPEPGILFHLGVGTVLLWRVRKRVGLR